MSSSTTASGGDQYIHNQKENSERQNLLNQCFRNTSANARLLSGIVAASSSAGEYKVLEIGCGAGFSTLDLARDLPKANILAIDTNADMIAAANDRLQQQENVDVQSRIEFNVLSGEDAPRECKEQFDAVWMRFVLTHVPEPVNLMQAAAACLKPGGILLVEDWCADGYMSDPPVYAIMKVVEAHIEASQKLGADARRGRLIGGYMRLVGLQDVQCNVFVPIYGKGVRVQRWNERSDIQTPYEPEKDFELALKLFRLSIDSLAPTLLRLEVITEQELERARQSIDEVDKTDYQVFTSPGGQTYQWWAMKPVEVDSAKRKRDGRER